MKLFTSALIFIIFIVLGCQITLAQSAQNNNRNNQIFISPLRVVDWVNPGIEIGYQRSYGKNLATLVSVARMVQISGINVPYGTDIPFTNYTGWRLQAEQKYFLPAMEGKRRRYFAVDVMYLKVNYDADETFAADTGRNTPRYTDDLHIDKTSLSFNMKYGVQLPLGHFIFDFVAGIGVKYKIVNWTGQTDPNAYRVPPRHPNAYYMANTAGKILTLSLPVNIRVAYEF
jgi:hypothetical protein